jgi:small-conductance mechanosensitive channel
MSARTYYWIPADRLREVLQPEPATLLLLSIVGAWLIYRFFLRQLSPERHLRLRRLFRNLVLHTAIAGLWLTAFWVGEGVLSGMRWYRIVPLVGLGALLWWSLVLLKLFRIVVFEYLFFSNMRTGVPVLIVNLLSLVLSLAIGSWILASVFEVHLAPLLATSAVFSIVLGLALQDTLGNLVAGLALQIDKPYGIGDWIEVADPTSGQRFTGQIKEISWRAVAMVSFTEEIIIIPNRQMAQAEVFNYSGRDRPFLRGLFYRIPYGQPIGRVREILLASLEGIPGVRPNPPPRVLFLESTENGMMFKLIYSLQDFGAQYVVADQINSTAMEKMAEAGIPIAAQRIEVVDQRAKG